MGPFDELPDMSDLPAPVAVGDDDPNAAINLDVESGDEGMEDVEPPPPDYDGEEKNIAKLVPHGFLTGLSALVRSSDEQARRSSEGWRNNVANYLKSFNGDVTDAGSQGQENLVPMHLPFVKRAVRTYSSKIFAQFFPPTGDIVNIKVRSPGLQAQAERVNTHMNFQLTNVIEEYIPSHDRGTPQLMLEGAIFETWWWDPLSKQPAQEISLAEDFTIPYSAKSDRPDMADVPFKTWTKRYQTYQLEELELDGYYIGITSGFEHPDGGTTGPICEDPYGKDGAAKAAPQEPWRDTPVKDVADQSAGTEKLSDDNDSRRKILEQDRMVKLPGAERQRMCTVCVDDSTGAVLRLSLCEKEDAKDRKRFNEETAIQQQQVQTAMVAHQQATEQHAAGQMDPMTGAVMPSMGPPPQPPEMPPPPAPVRKIPWHRHTRYDCNPNPEGSLGISLVADIYGHNQLADKIATRAMSLYTLNCLPTFVHSRQSKFGRGDFKLKLGMSNESPLPPQQVQDGAGLFRVQFPPPDPNWYKAVEMADNACQEVTAFNIASGGASMSGETATESEMRHSNATDNIAAIGQRINRARACSLKNLAYINSETLPDGGETIYKDGQPVTVTREDYQAILGEMEVTFTCDPSFESKPLKEKRAQKLSNAVDTIANKPTALGMPMVDPQACITLQRAAAVNYMRAIEAPAEMILMIANSPLPPPPPPVGMGPGQGAGGPPEGQGQENGQPGPGPGSGPPPGIQPGGGGEGAGPPPGPPPPQGG